MSEVAESAEMCIGTEGCSYLPMPQVTKSAEMCIGTGGCSYLPMPEEAKSVEMCIGTEGHSYSPMPLKRYNLLVDTEIFIFHYFSTVISISKHDISTFPFFKYDRTIWNPFPHFIPFHVV